MIKYNPPRYSVLHLQNFAFCFELNQLIIRMVPEIVAPVINTIIGTFAATQYAKHFSIRNSTNFCAFQWSRNSWWIKFVFPLKWDIQDLFTLQSLSYIHPFIQEEVMWCLCGRKISALGLFSPTLILSEVHKDNTWNGHCQVSPHGDL